MMRRPIPVSRGPITRRRRSAFAGADVCEVAGLRLAPGAPRIFFEQDVWLLTALADAHRQISAYELTWDFAQIINPDWRTVAKEVLLAMLAPQHDAVVECPHAPRTLRSPRTCYRVLVRLSAWFNWLTAEGIGTLEDVDQEMCERHLEEQSWSVLSLGLPRWRLDPETVRQVPRAMQMPTLYRDLLSTDGYRDDFIPWDGRSPGEIVGSKERGENAVQPVPDEQLQPLLATCLYLVDVVGPHLCAGLDGYRESQRARVGLPIARKEHLRQLRGHCEALRRKGQPLPKVHESHALRWDERRDDPLHLLAWTQLMNQAGFSEITDNAKLVLAPTLIPIALELGFEGGWGRDAVLVARHGAGDLVPWTHPLSAEDMRQMAGHVLTACLVLTSALTGMRSSELLELEVGCRQAASSTPGGGRRFRLSGKLIKGKGFGGVPDEWVVIEEVDRAIAIAERLVGLAEGEALFGNVGITTKVKTLSTWLVRTGLGEHWGLPPIPPGPCSARMLRRSLSLSIAQRPGGLLAAKIALKHISVATTEGYAARPGGSQRLFLAEMESAEEEHHLQLTVEAFREAQAGRMPAGPGARSIIEAFAHIDAELTELARTNPKVLADDRQLENLLRKLANTLHVGPANFCWFRDPSKALCLLLAGTPNATKPLVGMCDSARCPQATHHPCQRPVWAEQAEAIEFYITNPRVPKGEVTRLIPEHARALRVIAEIDAAAGLPAETMA